MENDQSVGNQVPTTPVNADVRVRPEIKPVVPSRGIPKYLYFVIPSALIIAGLLAYIFLSGGLGMFVSEEPTVLIPEEEIAREMGKVSPTASVSATPTGTPIPIIKGEETYSITQGKTAGPMMTKAVINPHDPEVGKSQKFTLYVNHTKPVTWVKIKLISDNKSQTYDLELTSGTPLDGQWSSTWTIDDTHLHTYAFTIEAGDGVNVSKSGIAIR